MWKTQIWTKGGTILKATICFLILFFNCKPGGSPHQGPLKLFVRSTSSLWFSFSRFLVASQFRKFWPEQGRTDVRPEKADHKKISPLITNSELRLQHKNIWTPYCIESQNSHRWPQQHWQFIFVNFFWMAAVNSCGWWSIICSISGHKVLQQIQLPS